MPVQTRRARVTGGSTVQFAAMKVKAGGQAVHTSYHGVSFERRASGLMLIALWSLQFIGRDAITQVQIFKDILSGDTITGNLINVGLYFGPVLLAMVLFGALDIPKIIKSFRKG